jgi:hypothetical protein
VDGDGVWREEIDSLAFRPERHEGQCVVHRLAFRTLVGGEATRESCLAFFCAHRPAFDAAAREKVARTGIARDANFHLNSRDLKRMLTSGA